MMSVSVFSILLYSSLFQFFYLRSVYSIEGLGGGVRSGDDPVTCSRACALSCLLAPCTGPASCSTDMTYNKFKRTLLLCLGLAIFLLGE